MTTKHTPGPWKIITLDGHTYINPQRPEGEWGLIAKMVGTSAYEESANAALIAAAPDLLAALEELLWAASRTSLETDGDYSNAFTAARAAIARATGGNQ